MNDWTQPCCDKCWDTFYENLEPLRMEEIKLEHCCFCGRDTYSGIYVRIDPDVVPYPTRKEYND